MLNISQTALEQLSALLLERAGLKIAPDGYHGLRLALSSRMPVLGIADAEEYVRRLRQLAGEHELRSLLPLVTVGKTEFFRDPRQFRALETRILPDLLIRARRESRRATIWSAGCATGEEPYSLAMVCAEYGAKPADLDLLATDLNPAAIENARRGVFPVRRMTGVSEPRAKRFFQLTDDGYQVIPALKELVHFEPQNLAAPVFVRVPPESLDLILCRNVIIYFDLPTIRGLMDRFLAALRPGGLLLLGYSESLFKVYDKFEMVEIEGAFVYRRPLGAVVQKRIVEWSPPRARADMPLRKTGEFPALAIAPPPSAPRVERPHRPPVERLNDIVKEMEQGRFEQALHALRKLVEDEPNDLDALLTLGNVYSVIGKPVQSLEMFAQAVAREPFCVEARVFGGVAQLQAGNLDAARAELSKALFLEPTLAMGHYLLAQVQEKAGDHDAARRSYRNAISQLRFPQRPLAGHYPDMPESSDAIARAAKYALSALEEISAVR